MTSLLLKLPTCGSSKYSPGNNVVQVALSMRHLLHSDIWLYLHWAHVGATAFCQLTFEIITTICRSPSHKTSYWAFCRKETYLAWNRCTWDTYNQISNPLQDCFSLAENSKQNQKIKHVVTCSMAFDLPEVTKSKRSISACLEGLGNTGHRSGCLWLISGSASVAYLDILHSRNSACLVISAAIAKF